MISGAGPFSAHFTVLLISTREWWWEKAFISSHLDLRAVCLFPVIWGFEHV